jgi:hypothetical protein
MSSAVVDATRITQHEGEQIERANASGRTPVVVNH